MENQQNPTVLILGASGTIGSQLVKDLENKRVNIRIETGFELKVFQNINGCKQTAYRTKLVHRIFNPLTKSQRIVVNDILRRAVVIMQRVGC